MRQLPPGAFAWTMRLPISRWMSRCCRDTYALFGSVRERMVAFGKAHQPAEWLEVGLSRRGRLLNQRLVASCYHLEADRLAADQLRSALAEGSLFKTTSIAQVAGMLAYQGKAKSIEEMDEAIAREAKRRARH